MTLRDELHTRELTYKPEYGDGVLLNYAWVKDGRLYRHSVTLTRPKKDTRLMMKWTTFRDRLTPGQKEEWTLSVSRPDGTPADAQLVASVHAALLQCAVHIVVCALRHKHRSVWRDASQAS